jgi:hypothetical protein
MRDILAKAEQMTAEIAMITVAPPSLELVGRIDGLLAAIAPGKGPIAPYLTPSERDGFEEQLRDLRGKIGVGYANSIVAGFARHPASIDGLRALEAENAEVAKVLEQRGLSQGHGVLAQGFAAETRNRVLAMWPSHVDTTRASFAGLQSANFANWRTLEAYKDMSDYLLKFINPVNEGGDIAATFSELEGKRVELAGSMLTGSEEKLEQWIRSLPPPVGANAQFDFFLTSAQKIGVDPRSRPRLETAMNEIRAGYNPLNLSRPDIAGALMRKHWSEVSFTGLEEVAYFMTITRSIDNICPGKVKSSLGGSDGTLLAFAGRLSMQATQHAFTQGPRNRTEGMRMVMMFFNTVANQPGCEVDYFGNVINCTTEQDFFATQEYIMTSAEGGADAGILTSQGCDGAPLQQYLEGVREYVGAYEGIGPGQPLDVPSFEVALAQ